jgi:hypothetical protein
MAHPSGEESLVTGKDTHQPRPRAANSEPAVKRRKRSLPSDAPTQMPFHLADTRTNTRVESAEYDQAAVVSVRRQTPRILPASFSVERATVPVKRIFVNDGDDNGVPSSTELEQLALQHNEGIHEQLLRQKRKISKLEAQLVLERAFTEEAQSRVRQDMLIDILREKTKLKKAEEATDIAKRRFEKEISELKVKLEKAAEKSLVERTQTLSAQSTAQAYRQDTEHMQHVSDTLQTDLEELRVVDTEDRRARKDKRHDLPPAYGNLDDEANFPPYSQHADAGSIEVALLKRAIRRKFERKIEEALTKPRKGTNMFYALSVALEDVSQDLKTLLDFAKDVHVSRTHVKDSTYFTQQPAYLYIAEHRISLRNRTPTTSDNTTNAMTGPIKRMREREHKSTQSAATLIQSANAAPYVADRIIKLILDILWRTVSACQLRPKHKSLNGMMLDPRLRVMYTTVDELLNSALPIAFSKSHSLAAFQYYLTQLEILAKKFKTLGVESTGHGVENGLADFNFFSKTLLWLNEQVEKERELRANEVQTLPVGADGESLNSDSLDDNDGVSSRWEGSDAGGDSESEGESDSG